MSAAVSLVALAKRVNQVRMHVAGANRGGDHAGALILEAARHSCEVDTTAFASAALRVIRLARTALDAMEFELLSLLDRRSSRR
jgi:hypothetical protein